MQPTRGMGQNFLIDATALHQIVGSANLTADDVVIEVGPGLGVLTWELRQQAGRVVSVELDKRLIDRLRSETNHFTHTMAPLHLIQGDILHIPPATILQQAGYDDGTPNPSYKVVANLPYAITSPVLRHFLEQEPKPQMLIVLVQREVAQRIAAQPGKLSMLAHAIQMYAVPEIVGTVPADAFLPVPAVDSAILRLHVREQPAVQVADTNAFFRILKAGFLQARKKLSNALPNGLAALGQVIPRDRVKSALEEAGVSPDRRAETLTLQEWAAVYEQLVQI